MKIISRQEANAQGLKWYFTGKPCKYGHVAERFASNCGCVGCARVRDSAPEKREWSAIYREQNREKIVAYSRKWRDANPSWKREGMPTPPRPAPSTCENCGGPPTGQGSLHFDHCHETGHFRGWLCSKCNTAIGLLGDNLAGVQRALTYLQRSTNGAT